MKYAIIIAGLLLAGCAGTPKLHKDVELGNESNSMMQCKILCDGTDKPYAFTGSGVACQCQRPVEPKAEVATQNLTPIMRFEVVNKTGQSDEVVSRGVAGQLLNGKMLISTVPAGGQ